MMGTSAPADVVVGVDSGGTRLRVAVMALDGTVLERREAPGGRAEYGVDIAAATAELLRSATAGYRVLAGAGSNGYRVADGWRDAGLGGGPFISLSEATLALDPADPSGVVLIGGTGAVCATVRDGVEAQLSSTVTGCAEAGSGWWLGGKVLESFDTPTLLGQLVRDRLEHDDEFTPRAVGLLAPLADQAARAGCGLGRELCAEAAAWLVGLVVEQRRAVAEFGRVLCVGSLCDPATVVGAMVGVQLNRMRVSHAWQPSLDVPAARWAASVLACRVS